MTSDHRATLPGEQKGQHGRSVMKASRQQRFRGPARFRVPADLSGNRTQAAGNGPGAPFALLEDVLPDAGVMPKKVLVLLIEGHRPKPEGLAALVQAQPGFEVVAAAEGDNPRLVEAVRRAAPATLDDFLKTLRAVGDGDAASVHVAEATMTRREREIRELIVEGLSNKEIAHRLAIATETVKGHVHNILEKLGLRTRLQVAAQAHKARAFSGRSA